MDALPDEILVWRSTDTLEHVGTWATTRYPAEAVAYVPKAEAAALRDRLAVVEAERDALQEAAASYQAALARQGIDGSKGAEQ